MTPKMFDKLNALVFFLFPEFQMTINTGSNNEVRPSHISIVITIGSHYYFATN